MKAYFTYTKNLLNHPDEKTRTYSIEQIKESLLESYRKDLDNKIARMKNLNLVGIFKVDKFEDELTECLKCYEDGRFISVVVLCGAIAETIAHDLIEEADIKLDGKPITLNQKEGFFRLSQAEKIELLRDFNIISPEVAGKMIEIKDKRNDYIHPQKKNPTNPEEDSKNMLNLLEDILAKLYRLVPVSEPLTNITQPLKLDREKVE